jgi:hypothetical protein
MINHPKPPHDNQYFIGQILFNSDENNVDLEAIPLQYHNFSRVFSKDASHKFPPSQIWDHAIELKPGAPSSLPRKLIPLF